MHRTLQAIKALGCRAGVAVNPHTPALLLQEIMRLVDTVIVMTVNPGFGGQSFLPEMLPKVRQIREMAAGRAIDIEVDGGVNTETALACVEAGANVLIAGTSVFNGKFSVAQGMNALRSALESKKPG